MSEHFSFRDWKNLDKVLLISCILLIFISLAVIGSATHINKGAINYDFVEKQGGFFLVNLTIILIACHFDYTKLKKIAKPLYIINLLMMYFIAFLQAAEDGDRVFYRRLAYHERRIAQWICGDGR